MIENDIFIKELVDELVNNYNDKNMSYIEALTIMREKMDREINEKKNISKPVMFLELGNNYKLGIDKTNEDIRGYAALAYEEYYEANAEIEKIINGKGSIEDLVAEILDEMQIRLNLLLKFHREGAIILHNEVMKHNRKLLSRGWEVSGRYHFTKEL